MEAAENYCELLDSNSTVDPNITNHGVNATNVKLFRLLSRSQYEVRAFILNAPPGEVCGGGCSLRWPLFERCTRLTELKHCADFFAGCGGIEVNVL